MTAKFFESVWHEAKKQSLKDSLKIYFEPLEFIFKIIKILIKKFTNS